MAIIGELGLEVKVIVNGSAAAEYRDEEPDDGHGARDPATKASHYYVESVDNGEFAIRVGLLPGLNTGQEWVGRSPDNAIDFSLAIDGGHDVARKCVTQRSRSRLLDGIYNRADATLRKFCFAPVSTVDDADKKRVAEDVKVAKSLGNIRIIVRRAVYTKSDKKSDGESDKKQASSHRDENFVRGGISMAEKALKGQAVSHGTALSAPVAVERPPPNAPLYEVEFMDTRVSPLAVFCFRYRSKEALQQQMVISRPRSPSIESNLETLSPDEIRSLARERLSEIKSGKKRALSVKEENVPRDPKSFKYVRIEGSRKAIDLTGDDSE